MAPVSPRQLKTVEYAAFNSIYDLCGSSATTAKYGCGWGLTCSSITTGPSQICLPNATLSNSIGKSCVGAACDPGTRCSSGRCVGARTRYNTCWKSAYQTSGYPNAECAPGYICGAIPAIGTDADAVSGKDGQTVIYVCLDRRDDFEDNDHPQRDGSVAKRDLVKRAVGRDPLVCYNGPCISVPRNPVI